MFTGLVETLGTIQHIQTSGAGRRLVIAEPQLAPELTIGESVAVNGACLTVIACTGATFQFEVGPETLQRTTFAELMAGDRVNLERSLRLGDRLGGHLVQGHVDGLGRIAERTRQGDWELLSFQCPALLAAQMVVKGSVAVDGVSLTLVDVAAAGFRIALIPHTLNHTTLGFKPTGAAVHLETDLFAKYVFKYLQGIHPST